MYIPAAFRETDTAKLHEFMQQNGFAILTTDGSQGLIASHLPLLLDPGRGPLGTLLGHFAKANEQADDFGCEALAIFSGPHAYISPTWYQSPNTVPTWNYVAVHAYGVMKPVDRETLTKILEVLVDKYESSRAVPWQFEPSMEFQQKLLDGIIGFQIEITRLEGKWKLNQNHPEERRQRVIAALNEAGSENEREIARLIAANVPS